MESLYTGLALYGSHNECARTDTVFLPISEVCDGTERTLIEITMSWWKQHWNTTHVITHAPRKILLECINQDSFCH